MVKIGLISDTHGHLDEKVFEYFKECDTIFHAGDIGTLELADKLNAFKPLRGVYGNIDGHEIRAVYPLNLRGKVEGLDIWMTHIGGYPGRYPQRIREVLNQKPPDIFICGHSHILKVMRDKRYNNMLTINPGAAGVHGSHKLKTIIRMTLDKGKVVNMEAIELGKRGSLK
ncbi:MAG: metallophosphoesterase family protein [Chitinophagales bacterium]|nr:metallophosphoesterase family protein [Chitinophagales bacterium]